MQKFTPLIVTEKKIISLKKKDGTIEPITRKSSTEQKKLALSRLIETESIDAIESGSQTKAILRSSGSTKKVRIDDEDIDEDELLADSPPPSKVDVIPTTMLTNRRIVVRNVDNVKNNENNLTNKATTGTGKGIFDRLDKKVIGVNESAKRKIQRIVINK